MKYLIILISILIGTSCQKKVTKKTNVILIMTDDQGWLDAGFNGSSYNITPNLDRIAGQGIILDRFYAASPVCSPTRASVLTGRNPLRMGIPHANTGHMLKEEFTLPEILKLAGYQTGHFGKWHLGTLTTSILDSNRGGQIQNEKHYSTPSFHGYDEYFCSEAKVPTYDPMIFPEIFEKDESKRFGWQAIDDDRVKLEYGSAYWADGVKVTENLEGDNSRIIMDRVIPFIQKSSLSGDPFFTTIWFHTPHLPVVSDSSYMSLFPSLSLQEKIYFGTIRAMDDQVGRLWRKLEELGIEDDTMLWFCSDNGPENETPGKSGIFRERKRSLYEGGVRVPAFVTWKSVFDGGIRMNFPAVTSDYLPTILSLLDLTIPEKLLIDGHNIGPLLSEEENLRAKPIGFIYSDYEKISWVDHNYKLISSDTSRNYELYDLIDDPQEQHNLILTKPDLADKMKNQLEDWLKSVIEDGNEIVTN